jgi:hypothetical protein
MTQDEIIEMAKQAGFEGCAELTWEDVICTEELVAFAKLVAQHEREACAKVCESIDMESFGVLPVRTLMITNHCAEAIRARGQA